jgi:glycosyltransferase involved in cell wall biosynthesis
MPKATHQHNLVVHATHEAGAKVGGIGAVLDGLLGTPTYNRHVGRTILFGPMDADDTEQMEQLTAPRNHLKIHYSSHHGVNQVDAELGDRLRAIEQRSQATLLYGTRAFGNAQHEIILVDARHPNVERLNRYKADLYSHFGIQSDRYEHDQEYSMHVNAAEPGYQALQAIAGEMHGTVIAHEFMGLPLCYSAMMHAPGRYRTVFYGHEVATVRPIVEQHPGHDTMFYNVLAQAQRAGRYLESVFGDQSHSFKHALVRPAAQHCHYVLAVGDWVLQEMRFLGSDWAKTNIDIVYNGIPSHDITLEQKAESRTRLQQYCVNLLNLAPDYVFTHVTRFVPSKGLWRDIRVMEQLVPLLAMRGASAVLFVLSSVIPVGRPPEAVLEMEARYGWPVYHREPSAIMGGRQVPDLVAHEIPFYRAARQFNRSTPNAKIILVNQFGWSQDRCGKRMPRDMTFADIRRGSDLEFGQSTYEPFGIAQVEPLSFGALCVISSVCGCLGFLRQVGGLDARNAVVADYTQAGALGRSVETALTIDQTKRDVIEKQEARQVAHRIADRLPQCETDMQQLIEQGYALSRQMSWEVVARDYLLPGLARAQPHG